MDDWELGDDELRALGLLNPGESTARTAGGADELASPFPNVHDLFRHYNQLYFESKLGFTSVEWSTGRMTLCAGICMFSPAGGCRIRLSEPLLKLRPVKDLKETLLHEMIHAYMFLEGIRDHDDHGPKFKAKMTEINTSHAPDHERPPDGYAIDTHHTMIAEVNNYRVHWWECTSCKDTIKRAMNRKPQPADCRGRIGRGDACQDPYCHYHTHLRGCGGEYVKIKGPDVDAAAAGKAPPSKSRKRPAGGPAGGASKAATGRKVGQNIGGDPSTSGRTDSRADDVGGGAAGASGSQPAGVKARGHAGGGQQEGGGKVPPITRFFQVQGTTGGASSATRHGAGHVTEPHGSDTVGEPGYRPEAGTQPGGTAAAVKMEAGNAVGRSTGASGRDAEQEQEQAVDPAELRRRCMVAALQRMDGRGFKSTSGGGRVISAVGGSSQAGGEVQPSMSSKGPAHDAAPASAPIKLTAGASSRPYGRTSVFPAPAPPQHTAPVQQLPLRHEAGLRAAPTAAPEVIYLDCSQDEQDLGTTTCQAATGQAAEAGRGAGASTSPGPWHAASSSPPHHEPLLQQQQQVVGLPLTCPVCCQSWPPDSITNAELNAHLDECIKNF